MPYHHGVPGSRWLRILLNRIDPALFSELFLSWAQALRPDAPDLVAIDGKTSRGSHDRGNGRSALHLVSAFATREKLVLAREAVGAGAASRPPFCCCWSGSPTRAGSRARSSPSSFDRLRMRAIACNGKTAQAILDAGADYLLAVKGNQPGLKDEIATFSTTPCICRRNSCRTRIKGLERDGMVWSRQGVGRRGCLK